MLEEQNTYPTFFAALGSISEETIQIRKELQELIPLEECMGFISKSYENTNPYKA